MASLCTLLIACNKEEIVTEANYTEEIQKRSTDDLTVTYLNSEGQEMSQSCTQVQISYYDTAVAQLSFVDQNNNSITTYGEDIEIVSNANDSVEVTPTGGLAFLMDDIIITVCGGVLCYTDSIGLKSGTAAGFIVEDDPQGI